jgi:predicted nucleotidyltransferase
MLAQLSAIVVVVGFFKILQEKTRDREMIDMRRGEEAEGGVRVATTKRERHTSLSFDRYAIPEKRKNVRGFRPDRECECKTYINEYFYLQCICPGLIKT